MLFNLKYTVPQTCIQWNLVWVLEISKHTKNLFLLFRPFDNNLQYFEDVTTRYTCRSYDCSAKYISSSCNLTMLGLPESLAFWNKIITNCYKYLQEIPESWNLLATGKMPLKRLTKVEQTCNAFCAVTSSSRRDSTCLSALNALCRKKRIY